MSIFNTPITWDAFFMSLAWVYASKSKDNSTKVGCVIIGPDNEQRSAGYNGMPRGVNDDDVTRYERPRKYRYFEHAERNAIYNAARVGIPLKGCRLYITMMCCSDCARGVIQAGIIEVVVPTLKVPDRWAEDVGVARAMLLEAGVEVRGLDNV